MKITRRQLRKLINEVTAGASGNRTEFSPDECAIALAAAQEFRDFREEFARVNELPFDGSLDQPGLNMKEKLINCVSDNTSFLAKDQAEGETAFMNLVLDDVGTMTTAVKEKLKRLGRDDAQYGSEPQSGKPL